MMHLSNLTSLICLAPFVAVPFVRVQDGRATQDTLPAILSTEVPLGLPAALGEGHVSDATLALGRRLFFDPILSSDRTIQCASCHDPEHGFSDDEPFSTGVQGRKTLRNSPTLLNRALGSSFFWDGRTQTLEEQVLMPIENELEMDLSLDDAVARLAADESYVAAFGAAFGQGPSREKLSVALAGFVRRLWRGDSALDRFRQGDHDAFDAAERGGLWFFESRGGCWRCHTGPNLTDENFHNTGVGVDGEAPELGRAFVTGIDADRGAFKTPTLRGLSQTAPYMHDGSRATIEDVVEFYRQGGHPNAYLDERIAPLDMTDSDVANLVAFLRTL